MTLEENVLKPKQELYLDWLCTPRAERNPSSKEAWAKQYETTTQTLRAWEKNKVFLKEWKTRVDDIHGSPEKTNTLLETLYQKGVKGDPRAIELYMKITGKFLPPVQKVEVTQVHGVSDAELDMMIAEEARREAARRALEVK